MNIICKKIKVSGRVQGVFFRAFTQKIAEQLNIKGWVRNEQDGSVMACACGEEESLNKFIELLRQGPPASKVTGVNVESIDTQVFNDFVIQR